VESQTQMEMGTSGLVKLRKRHLQLVEQREGFWELVGEDKKEAQARDLREKKEPVTGEIEI